jgi:hypothetical protein
MNDKAIETIKERLTAIDTEQRFLDSLNENTVTICGLEYAEGDALKEVDPTAFRCGHNDYVDAECQNDQLMEIDNEHYNFDEAQEIIDEIESEEDSEEEE